MRLLTLQDKKVTISPEALTLVPFKKLWERDKSKNKANALEDVAYVYYFADFSSVYRSINEEERKEALLIDVYDNKRKPDKLVEETVQFYKDKQTEMSPSLSFLEAAQHAANQMKEYFYSVDFKKVDVKGQPIYDAGKINTILGVMSKTLDGLDKLRDKVSRELQSESKVRGGVEISMFENPDDE